MADVNDLQLRIEVNGEVRQRAHACGLDAADMNPALRETTHDFILNRRFRRDVFVRGTDRLARPAREALLRQVGLVLLRPVDMARGQRAAQGQA